MLLFKNAPKKHKLTHKTTIPKPKEQIFAFPTKMKPFDAHVWPDPTFQHNLHPSPPLFTQTQNVTLHSEKGVAYDHFSTSKLSEILGNPHQDLKFLGRDNQAIKLPTSKFPNLPDDYENYQNLDKGKLQEDLFDKENDYVDIYLKNKNRLARDDRNFFGQPTGGTGTGQGTGGYDGDAAIGGSRYGSMSSDQELGEYRERNKID